MQEIFTAISTIGFPAVMCLMMFKRMDTQDQRHAEETSKLTEALNNNTLAITKLEAKLGGRTDE